MIVIRSWFYKELSERRRLVVLLFLAQRPCCCWSFDRSIARFGSYSSLIALIALTCAWEWFCDVAFKKCALHGTSVLVEFVYRKSLNFLRSRLVSLKKNADGCQV